jgi:hypothetical protein
VRYRLGAPEVEGLQRFLTLCEMPARIPLARFSQTACVGGTP